MKIRRRLGWIAAIAVLFLALADLAGHWISVEMRRTYGIHETDQRMGRLKNSLNRYFDDHHESFPVLPALTPIYEIGLDSRLVEMPMTPWGEQYHYRGDSQSYELWAAVNQGRGSDDEPGTGDEFRYYSSRLGGIQETSVWAP